MSPTDRADLASLAERLGAGLRWEQPLAELTTWRIGGPAEAVLAPATREAVVAAVALARAREWPLRVVGNGSNLLCPDQGVRGLVLQLANHLTGVCYHGTCVRAEAGTFLPRLAREAASRGLGGLECVVGVPGTVGGGCVMNAGVPDGTLGDVLREVEVLRPDGGVATLRHEELGLAHRESRLQHEDWLVLSATLDLHEDDPAAVARRMDEHMAYRRRTQPLSLPSCGSVFRRPADGYPGALLEQAGCKGLRRGGAQVSALHANWIVNLGGATAADVGWLMAEVQRRVRDQSGVELVPEVTVWAP